MRKLGLITAFLVAPFTVSAEEEVDNGTDPTKVTRSFVFGLEHTELGSGIYSDTATFRFTTPLPGDGRTGLQLKLPLPSSNAVDSGFGLGDVSAKLIRVLTLTPQYGIVATGEVVLDTADRADRGAGVDQFKLGVTYARFLEGGAIFAPALIHTESLGSVDAGRADISSTVIDFYYVPKLADSKTFVTFDPSIKMNWETDTLSSALAVTIGRTIETGLPGSSSLFIKPSAGLGGNKEFDWGVEVGFKVVGF